MRKFNNDELKKYGFNMDTIRVFDVFAGIGALHQSLKELGVPIEITNLSEVDVDAIISYAGIHIENFKDLDFDFPSEDYIREWLLERNIGYDFQKQKSSIPRLKKDKLYKVYKASVLLNNLGDISKINYNDIEDFDLMNLSFCCQDLSNAGQQKGLKNEDGTPTRSGLVVYGLKAIRAKMPKYIMIENVKALIQKKFINDFYEIIKELDDIGYDCFYPTKKDKKGNIIPICLNAKDYGIPQNRERIYIICIRKDLNKKYDFPKGFDNGMRLKDILEEEVDEKYYLKDTKNFFIKNSFDMEAKGNGFRFEPYIKQNATISKTITTRAGSRMDDNFIIENIYSNREKFKFDSTNEELKQVRLGGIFDTEKSKHQAGSVWDKKGLAPTLDTMQGGYRQPCIIEQSFDELLETIDFIIRKLTPKECWRLMGFKDGCFDKTKELGLSDSALYKQAGNSIVVNVLYYIFKELFKEYIVE